MGLVDKNITRFKDGGFSELLDPIVIEEALEIRVKQSRAGSILQKRLAVTMRTPGQDEDLVRGFLFTEGIVQGSDQILSLSTTEKNIVEAHLSPEARFDLKQLDRNFFVSSSCGICGKASKDNIETESPFLPWSSQFTLKGDVLLGLQQTLIKTQSLFSKTGGVHAAALFDSTGKMKLMREDLGRHNALDKLLGASMAENPLPINDALVLVSGRASFELIQKAGMAGVPVLCAVGAPSSLAIEAAENMGMTLIGFLKPASYNIYCGAKRVL